MALQWYYKVMGQEAGPVSSSELQDLAASGFLTPDVEVRKGTEGDWTAAARVNGLFEGPSRMMDEEVDGPVGRAPCARGPAQPSDRGQPAREPVAKPRPSPPSPSPPSRREPQAAEVVWYCQAMGREIGPLSLRAVKELAAAGFVAADVLVREGADGDWIPAKEVPGLLDAKPSTAPAREDVEKSSPPARKTPAPNASASEAPTRPAPARKPSAPEPPERKAPAPRPSAPKSPTPEPAAPKPPARKAPARDASAPSAPPPSGIDIPDDDGLFALVNDRIEEPPSGPGRAAEASWHYQAMGEKLGPVSWAELKELAETGFVTPEVLVRQGDDGPWVPASQVKGLFDGGPAPAGKGEPPAVSEPEPLGPASLEEPEPPGLAPLPEDRVRRPAAPRPRQPAPQRPAPETRWYYEVEGRAQGPLTAAELKERAKSGQLAPGHLIRKGEAGPWIPASQVKGLFPQTAPSAPSPRAPAESSLPAAEPTRPAATPSRPAATPSPTPAKPSRPAAHTGAAGSRQCPSCGREYKVWGEMASRTMQCTCGELLRPPGQAPAAPPVPSSASLFDDLGPPAAAPPIDPAVGSLGSLLDEALEEPRPAAGAPGALPPRSMPSRARPAAAPGRSASPFGGEPSGYRPRGTPGMVSRVLVGGFMTFVGAVGAIVVLGIVVLVAVGLLFGGSQIAGALAQATKEGGALFWISALIYFGLLVMTGFAASFYLTGGIGILRGESEGAEKGVAASTMVLTMAGIDLVWSIILAIVVAQRTGASSEKLGGVIGATIFFTLLRSIMPAALLFWCSKYGPRLPN